MSTIYEHSKISGPIALKFGVTKGTSADAFNSAPVKSRQMPFQPRPYPAESWLKTYPFSIQNGTDLIGSKGDCDTTEKDDKNRES